RVGLTFCAMLDLFDIRKSFGSRTLFSGVNLRVNPRDRLGLVGPNGTGKTTLFRIILNEISPDSGRVEVQKNIRMGYLAQEVHPSHAGTMGLAEYCVLNARGVGPLQKERAACVAELERLGHDNDNDAAHVALAKRLAHVEDRLLAVDADHMPGMARSILVGLGFAPEDVDRPMNTMSGGLLMRVELARLLLDEPDLLLLDEPTNHLDLEGILWFENYLSTYKGAVVMIAHDRQFLNRTVTHVVEVGPHGATDFGGDPSLPVYDRYVIERAKWVELQWKRYYEQQDRIAEMEDYIARNRARLSSASAAQSRMKALDKMERIQPPSDLKKVHFRFPPPPRIPDLALSVEDVTRRYGDRTVFSNLNLRLHRGERMCLIGLNGAGKSTLLRLCAGIARPDEGRVAVLDTVSVGYFAQDSYEILNPESTVEKSMMEVADFTTAPFVRHILGAFLFSDDDYDKKVVTLSGGEKARLVLARLLLQPFGILVLDEPTNHLDISSREILESAIMQHSGAIIFTTHDRRFMDNVATTTVELKDGQATRWEGNYSYYLSRTGGLLAQTVDQKREINEVAAQKRAADRDRKRDEAERRNRLYRMLKPLRDRVESYEKQISTVEADLKVVEEELVSPTLYEDMDRARQVSQRAKELRDRLDSLFDEWTEAASELASREQSESEAQPGQ
ncbi:MAG TPA: ATP-binding cassette domain-containing protein, partial [Myxococcota bacterium]|nr:ATP-binding cassette domain-containing protein [Myxococcota bacterium]